jgi:phosphoglycerol transferase MdoB-like AlkP superfamily enzyme
MTWLRTLMLLALIVWIGGIISFAFVLAPTLFGVLPTTKLAGDVVNATLIKLHWMGLVSGVVFLICSLLYNWKRHMQLRPFIASHIFIVLMLTFTVISQFRITPRMRELRSNPTIMEMAGGRAEFDRLHVWSTRLEAGILFLGLGVVILTARRFENSN